MRILDEQLARHLASGDPIRLELGSGGPGREGFYGLDLLPLPGAAIQADLNEPLDQIPDNSVSEVYSQHCLEHVGNFLGLMREMHRIIRPGGRMVSLVPHFSNPYYYSDPTHVRFFGLYTMYYFAAEEDQPERKVPCFYTDVRFRVNQITLYLMDRSLLGRLAVPMLGRKLNRTFEWQDYYERRLCRLFPAAAITYDISPVKD